MFNLDVQSDLSKRENSQSIYDQCSNCSLYKIPSYSGTSSMTQKTDFTNTSKKKDLFHLRKLITKHKVKVLTKNFISKLSQNNTQRKPSDIDQLQNSTQLTLVGKILKKFQQTNGLFIGNTIMTIWSLINVVQIAIMVYIFSILIAFFQGIKQSRIILYFRISSIVLYLIDISLNFITQRFQNGKRLKNLKQIGTYYISNGFYVDLASVLIFPLDLVLNSTITIFISFFAIIKLWNTIKKLQKLEYLYIKNAQRQQYYGLIKIFITNFVIGHFLSILLNMMALLNSQRNWQFIIGIQNADWLTKYIWGYYWGTNIMLTVGFGDISATNTKEAGILIFIQTISCITLAYNISTVGALMTQIRASNQKKKKQLKVFHRMSQQNQIPGQLNKRISNFIEESFQIRQTFQFQEEDQLIQSLPKGFQSQYRIQANRILFDKIGFLNNLSAKTLILLAQKIQRKISHPDQIIKKKGALENFMIVSNGILGMCYRRGQSKANGTIIQKVQHKKGQKPKLVSLGFIKGKYFQVQHHIFPKRNQFVQYLKEFQLDYQFFCTMRDRDNYVIGQDQIYKCSLCKNEYHTKFDCSRLHYIPIKQNIIYKKRFNDPKCNRFQYKRPAKTNHNKVLLHQKKIKSQYQNFLKHHFGHTYIQKLPISKIYFEKLVRAKSEINLFQKRREGLLQKNTEKKVNQEITNDSIIISHHTINNQVNSNYQKIQKLLLRQNYEYKGYWDLEIDQVHNFRYYFSSFNAENLGDNPLTTSKTL